MAGTLTELPTLAPTIEEAAFRLKKKWRGMLVDINDVLQDSRTFLETWGRTEGIAALGNKAAPMAQAYAALKDVIEEYTDFGDQPTL